MEAARRATADDVERLVALHREALAHLAEFRGGELYAAHEAHPDPEHVFASAVGDVDGDAAVWVGTVDGVVLGFALVRTELLRNGESLGVIDDLFVEEGARSVGLGEALMAEVVQWCRDRGCRGIDAIAMPGDRNTKNFFEMSGFTARLLRMHHRL